MRGWVVAAVICFSVLAIATTEALLLGSHSDSVDKGPYANLWIFPYPADTSLEFCSHPEAEKAPTNCVQLSDSAISDVLGSRGWPAPIPSSGCTTGWVLKVYFLDGTHLTYGPCPPYPPTIVELREWLIQHFASP